VKASLGITHSSLSSRAPFYEPYAAPIEESLMLTNAENWNKSHYLYALTYFRCTIYLVSKTSLVLLGRLWLK